MTGVATFADLAAEVLARPPRVGQVRVVAVDGPAGSGKTTFTGRLVAALRTAGASVGQVSVDDVRNGWSDIADWWPWFRTSVLSDLRSGRSGWYRRYDWATGRHAGDPVAVAAVDVLVLDGVGSASAGAADELTLTVWIAAADPGLRLRRLVERDGEPLRPDLQRWMAAEEAHFVTDRTARRADVRVDGAPAVAHDPSVQYVRSTGRWTVLRR
ncbi:MAG TPA: hypothetical protein VK453_23490 [Micromonosporaceae bacterium]|nr:hypothetical protein [Micromonosporaceae bacterium]